MMSPRLYWLLRRRRQSYRCWCSGSARHWVYAQRKKLMKTRRPRDVAPQQRNRSFSHETYAPPHRDQAHQRLTDDWNLTAALRGRDAIWRDRGQSFVRPPACCRRGRGRRTRGVRPLMLWGDCHGQGAIQRPRKAPANCEISHHA